MRKNHYNVYFTIIESGYVLKFNRIKQYAKDSFFIEKKNR